MIKIVCGERKGFRRGGVLHVRGENLYPEDYFTEEQLAQIKAEPKLVIEMGLKPTKAGLLSFEELYSGLESYKVGFDQTEPRELLVKKLKKAIELAGSAAEPGNDNRVDNDLIEAARQAIADGNTIGSGAPDCDAMAKILDRTVTAAERNQAWDAIQAE